MKTSKILKFIMVLIASVAITSCVQDDDYTIPSSLGDEENAAVEELMATATEISFAQVKALYTPGSVLEPIDTDVYVKGYVSSSDHTGNFFKEFFIQDSPSNPTAGIKVILNQVDTYNQFNLGREVVINLKGLYIGEERVGNGVTTIGGAIQTDQFGTKVLSLNEIQIKKQVLRTAVTEEITPKVVTFSELTNDHVGIFVSVENVEFPESLAGQTYFDPNEVYDTKRTMQACGGFDYTYFKLETSGFATFKNESLPTGNGTISAVVGKTFDGASLILALNSTDDVNMNGERCSLLDPSDFSTIFSEDFESAVNNTNLDFPGWTNFAEAGSRVWREKTFDGNGYTELSSFGSGNPENIAWLVTPGIDMDAQDNEFLKFKTAQHHLDSPENTLEVFVSTDYDGSNVLSATWIPVAADLATQSNSWYEWVDSGLIDISSYSGTLYVAFKYVGSGTNEILDGAYQIDNLEIIAPN
ncbi:uncharacterized protein DUF5017 [Winogradskyella epiphytica]|uniref:Uncharacterized protein DUF5017 n=1 Tax=Winogradskyella epiphytica TaxID=262005 RepID=A0A2V4Y3I2_9FLAO|nr:DUF5689 domain-containing protein [Winogradskyella epiphytica]PYE83444.1 uncharacterized protein DUF5017 [Winogradskyella epiphytica]GGW58214.1 hypothetical protein GCM10008085_07360 [Winogradskyella epiphytica]